MSRTRHPLKAYLSTDGIRPTSACCSDCVTGAGYDARQELRTILTETEPNTPDTWHERSYGREVHTLALVEALAAFVAGDRQ